MEMPAQSSSPITTATSASEGRLKLDLGKDRKRKIVKKLVTDAAQSAKDRVSSAVGNVKTYVNKNKIANSMTKDLPNYTKNEASENVRKMVKKGNYSGARGYMKDQLTKLDKQTKDEPTSNAYVREKLKKYSK